MMRKLLLLLCCCAGVSCSGPSEKGERVGDGAERLLLAGDYPDPSILRDGDTYYMVHSSFEYVPGLLVFKSKNLVDWEPAGNALREYVGSVYAPDIVKHDGRWYIYFPAVSSRRSTNMVVWADAPEGPWSDPVDLGIGGIDPGHAVDAEGNRFLMMSNGCIVPLSADGLSVKGPSRKVYDGWQYPSEWDVEGFCLEGPKVTKVGDYYYMLSAEGGTAGPPTSHMVVLARSKSLFGPWENSPYNPLVHTSGIDERWWSKGHGTLVSTPGGEWYVVYHAYENGFYTLGRQTLLEPVRMTEDGWFVSGGGPDGLPASRRVSDFSDDFSSDRIGTQWRFVRDYDPERIRFGDRSLTLKGRGKTPADAGPMLFVTGDHAYEMEVEAECSPGTSAGLILYYNPSLYAGIALQDGEIVPMLLGRSESFGLKVEPRRVWFRLRNDRHVVSLWYSLDGRQWTKLEKSCETSGYHHNMGGGFLSLQPGIYAAGEGEVTFRNFIYRKLETAPNGRSVGSDAEP